MTFQLTNETWVWVIIQNPEKQSSYLGQHDTTNDIKFLPFFEDKESALMCLNQFSKDESFVYEAQAVLYEDLITHAKNVNFIIYFLDKKGAIIKKIDPTDSI